MRDKVDTLALAFGSLGFICLAISLLLPRWYISGSYGVGPWMECKWDVERWCGLVGGDLLGLSIPLWIGTTLALSALLISGLTRCGTSCCGDNVQKKLFASGCLYLLSFLVALGPVIVASYVLWRGAPSSNVGECLYLAWVSLGFLMAAGVLQLHHHSPCRRKEEVSHNCTPSLEHEAEERCGEDSIHFSPPETMCERGKLEKIGDSITEQVQVQVQVQVQFICPKGKLDS